MTARGGYLALGILAAATLARGASLAAPGPQCEAEGAAPPVSIVVVASSQKLAQYVESVRGVRVLRADDETVVFADGRVVSANVAAVGAHLNALGWAERPIRIVASFSKSGGWRPSPG